MYLGGVVCNSQVEIVSEEQSPQHGTVFTLKIENSKYAQVRLLDLNTAAFGFAVGIQVKDPVRLSMELQREWLKKTEAQRKKLWQERIDFEKKMAAAAVDKKWGIK